MTVYDGKCGMCGTLVRLTDPGCEGDEPDPLDIGLVLKQMACPTCGQKLDMRMTAFVDPDEPDEAYLLSEECEV